jgi:hypothetical protein
MSLNPPTNTTKFLDLLTFANNKTDSWFGNLILIATFVITFIVLKRGSVSQAIAAAGFVTTIFAIGFWALGIAGHMAVLASIFMTAIGGIGMYYESKY